MKDILKLIKEYKTTKYKKEHYLILLERSREMQFPVYSLVQLLESICRITVKIISSEGWIESDFGLQQKRKLLKKEQEVHKKVTAEFEKNKKKVLLVKKKHLLIPAIITVLLLIYFAVIPIFKSTEENKFWDKVCIENTMASYEYYINRYPEGKYFNDALLQKDILTREEKARQDKIDNAKEKVIQEKN